jgi:MFS family permease
LNKKYNPPNYYYIANLFAALAAGMMIILGPWVAVEKTGQAFSSGLIMLIIFLPNLLAGPFIGNLSDHFNNKKLCFSMDVIRGVLFVGIYFFLISDLSIIYFYILIFLQSIANAIYRNSAGALVKKLFPNELIAKINSTNLVFREVGYLAGTGISGIVMVAFGPETNAIVIATFFIVSALFILKLKLVFNDPNKDRQMSMLSNIKEGISYINERRDIATSLIILALTSVSLLICPVVLSPLCIFLLKTSSTEFGFIEMSWAGGAILAGVIISKYLYKNFSLKTNLIFQSLLLVGFVICYLGSDWQVYLVAYFILGLSGQVTVIQNSRIQTLCDPQYIGRIYGTFNFIFSAFALTTFSIVSYLTMKTDLRNIYLISFSLVTVAVVLALTNRKKLFSELPLKE